jgi:hypothetical protein
MATKIIHKKSSVAEKVPLTTDLEVGELAINLVDKKLFSKDGNGNIIEFGSVEVQQLTVYNGTGATIPKGSAVYINGAQGQRPSIALASNASEATSSKTIGFVNADILNGAEGVVTTEGLVYNLNTAAFTEGGAIYLGATAGSITQTKPVAPAHLVSLGWVVKAHASSGRILAHVQNGFELNELHDVLITSPANTQVLAYETSTGLWKNSNLDWANVQNKPDPVITLAGDLSGSVTLTDLASGTLTATIAANSVALGTDTTGNYVATIAAGTSGAQTSSSGLTITAVAGEGTAAIIAHADTSTQASVDNANGTVIQDVTLDTYGHVTGLASVDLDGRYYTETEIQTSNIPMRSMVVNTNGIPSSNLGTPTVAEMALFDAQFDNKTERFPIANFWIETSTDNVTWTDAGWSDANKRVLVGGDSSNSSVAIPYGTPYFRIRMRAVNYVYLNALYAYFSTQGHTTGVQMFKKHDSGAWTQHTSSTAQVNSWPGHLYLPFSTIPWNPTATLGTHWHEVYVLFTPTWNASFPSNPIAIYKTQLWGGYPSGRRNLYATDELGNAAFPAAITANGNTVWNAGNDGTGSGLDADLLDGNHASAFYLATNPSGYTSNTGTLTAVTGTAPIVSSGGTTPAISITAATTSAAGSMSAADKTKLDGIATSANNYSLPAATSTALGGIELFSDTAQTVAANTVSTTAGRTYGLQANGSGQGVVNVPWTDTNTTSLPIKNSAGVTQITVTDTTGLQFVGSGTTNVAFDSPNSRVTISSTDYTLPAASSTTRGGVELFSDTIQTTAANATSQTASRTYGVQANSDAQLVVNVPWTDTVYTLPAATSTVLGGIELASDTVQTVAAEAVSATASRTYGVQVNAAGQAVVNVPWVDTNSGGNALTSNTLAQFAATTSAQLAGVISDETGSGKLTFATSPTFTTSVATDSATLSVFDTTATTVHAFGAATTGNLGYDGTAASTTNLSVGANTSGVVKTVNIGTGGASGSTTNITLGSVTAGANSSVIVPGNMSLGQNISAVTGPVLTLGTLVGGGSGFMNGTHTNQVFTGGTGSYMLGTVTVALGVVTGVTLTWGGHRYTTGDVLTVPSLSTTLATTAASGTGTTATITFAAQAAAPFEVGSQIIVAGVTPTGYNGTFTVTACTTTSVSYATITTGAQTVAGTVKMGTPLTASTIPVATVQGTDLYVSSYTSDAIGSRIRLETNDTSTVAGQEYGAITFSGRDASANGSGDLALIRGVGVGTSGGSDLQFWTAANGGAPKTAAVITSAGNFRLYNSAGTFYSELSNSPTTNRTITIPDGTGTLVFDTSPSFTTGINAASTTMALFDTTATTVNAFGATTTLNLGYDGTAQSTTNISTGVVASGVPKTVNIGTGGSGASTTNINIGANDNGGLTINSSAVNAPNANLTAYTLAADYIDANAGVMQIHAPAGFGAQLNFYPDASTYGWSINAETDNTISFYSQTPNEAVFRVGAAGQIGVGVVTDYGTAGQVLTSGGTAGEASWTTLPTATSTVKGVVELFSDTVQTVAANAVTATASRTYGIQLNAANQMVVNVPWTSGAPTTAEVGTATAGLAVGDVGSYALLWHNTTAAETPGTTVAGSTLRYANTVTDSTNPLVGYGATAPAGTWRIMGHTAVQGGGTAYVFNIANVSVWLRIS